MLSTFVGSYVILPKCDPFIQQVIHPCREMCQDVLEGCWQELWALLARMSSEFRYNNYFYFTFLPDIRKLKLINCNYLPSLHGSVPCFYKNVTCDSPPDVTNGTRIINATEKNVYELYDVVQYACVNETFTMKRNSAITCLYSGEWSHPPPTCIPQGINFLNALHIVLPVLIASVIIYTCFASCAWCRKTVHQNLTRDRKYDAFVCYCYEGQDPDFAEKIIPQELEKRHGLKLCIHRRDFKAG